MRGLSPAIRVRSECSRPTIFLRRSMSASVSPICCISVRAVPCWVGSLMAPSFGMSQLISTGADRAKLKVSGQALPDPLHGELVQRGEAEALVERVGVTGAEEEPPRAPGRGVIQGEPDDALPQTS